MKQSILLSITVICLISTFKVYSQSPGKINFQSILRNTAGEIVSNKAVSIKMSILSGNANGTSVYSETHVKTTDVSGLISIKLGSGTVINGIFGDIEWGSASHFIQLEVDFNGGSNYVVIGTQELISVPYALYANKTDTSVLNLANRLSTKLSVKDTASLSNRINAKANLSDTSLLNLTSRFSTKLNVTDTSSLSNRINTKAILSDTSLLNLTSRFSTKLNVMDTASLSNRINTKLNVTDTASLSNRIDIKLNGADTASLSNRINTKLNRTDTASLSNRIDTKLNRTDTVSLSNRINTKLDITDTVLLSNRINTKLDITDTVLLSNRINTKLNGADTASLSNRIDTKLNGADTASLSNRIDTKLNVTDTASLSNRINAKLNVTDTVLLSNRINTKLNAADTTSLSNRMNTKLNRADTASLSNRIDTKLNVTDTASISNRIDTKLNVTDTASLSNRINTKLNITDTASLANRIDTKLNVTDTAVLSNRMNTKLNRTDTASLSNRMNTKLNVTDTASLSNRMNTKLNVTDTAYLSNRINTKLNVTDTALLSNRINTKLNETDVATLLNPYFKIVDTTTLNLTNIFNAKLNVTDFPQGTAPGSILIWNNGNWVNLAPGSPGQSLIFSSSGILTWGCIITNTAGSPSSSPSLGVNTVLTNITISTTGATGIGTATGLPAGVTALWSNNVITISGTPRSSGSFTYTIPLTGGCGNVNATGTITVTFTCVTNQISDVDNNNYNTVLIGTQCWLKENLRVRRYNNGTAIPFDTTGGSVGSSSKWQNLTIGAHTIYAHDSTATIGNLAVYGYLYNWYAAKGIYKTGTILSDDTLNICPSGWHVPTDAEWTTLTTELGGASVAGRKMKSEGNSYWSSESAGTDNSSGFSGLPGGWRSTNGSFTNIRFQAFFWSATESSNSNAWRRMLEDDLGNVGINNNHKLHGASVRCLRD